MLELLIHPILAGIITAFIAGPLGSIMIWRRMAFFGDTLAHSALAGIAFSLLLDTPILYGLLLIPVGVAIFMALVQSQKVQSQKLLATDTWLAIVAHGTLAIGLVALSFVHGVPVDLHRYLFGDILAVGLDEVLQITAGGLLILATLAIIWRPLLSMTINEDLAAVDGISLIRTRLIFMMLVALTVTVAIKVIGVLLLTALLLIPAASARRFSKTPEQMAGIATAMCLASVLLGFYGSVSFDTPTAPSIVVAALGIFAGTSVVRQGR
ncbi:MAG: metal ABC transporter permease [Pseudomonadota bacterium]